MRQFVVASSILFVILGLISPSIAQVPEEKKSERNLNNQFLDNQTSEPLDLLQRYYQRAFSQQGRPLQYRSDLEAERLPTLQALPAIGLEGPINPRDYIVGPFDILSIVVSGNVPLNYSAPVAPEGVFIVPTVGEIAVAGDTLAQVKKKIAGAIRKKYTAGEISVNLVGLRQFKVIVAGAVANPGSYLVSPVDRVDHVVYLANLGVTGASPAQKLAPASGLPLQAGEPRTRISLRNIRLIRASHDTLTSDLMRYYASGDARYNPYLRDGDVIFVPAENIIGNMVTIYGGVLMPGCFEFHEGDSMRTLLQIAQGPTALADLEHVEVARFLADGRRAETLMVNWRAIEAGQAPDMPLQRNDQVFIRENPELRKERVVEVKGAAARPGKYALLHEHTMLSEILERAGGFTAEASIAESKLIRRYAHPDAKQSDPDYARLIDIRLSDLNLRDREYFDYETALKRGFVAVDFPKLFNHHDKSADVEVWENDEILIPSLRMTVNVFGQVLNPGYVTYVEKMDYRYYIEKTGGFGREADKDKIRVLKRNTQAWLNPDDAMIEPGDQVFVPRRLRRPSSVYFNTFRDVLQTTASFATVYLLYRQVTR